MLRMENLDTDLRRPPSRLDHTRRAVEEDEANSYLPFEGHLDLRTAAAGLVSGPADASTTPRASASASRAVSTGS
jgi:hypothetical protein